nr:asparagine synthase (glutamine-hydrolyzing) [Elusimicrobiota bacterium]
MCGICGIINLNKEPVSERLLRTINSTLYHRGPDDEGYFFNKVGRGLKVGLGMRRLSIIDLSTGNQPVYNEDKSIVTVFNGEIYNFRQLKENLIKKGHRFYTKGDTEVIAHLWEEYGPECVKKLNGMFAVAIWDNNKQELFLTRDRVGQKPLYYAEIGGNFYFASEIKSFLKIPGFKKEVNKEAIHNYLTYQYIPTPMTIWKGVKALKPANFMFINENGIKNIQRYWDIDYRNKTKLNFRDSKAKIRALLKDATQKRMISDVPLGAFLSGGHDSSIVVGLMSEISDRPVKTFSVGFKEEEFSELKYAKIIADKFNTEHHEFIVDTDFKDLIPDIVSNYSQPYADCSALPSYYIAKMTKNHVKVALNGDAGDENYAGYLRYRALKISEYISKIYKFVPKKLEEIMLRTIPMNESVNSKSRVRYLHRFIGPLRDAPAERNLVWHAYFTNDLKNSIYSKEMKNEFNENDSYGFLKDIFNNAPAENILDKSMYADI